MGEWVPVVAAVVGSFISAGITGVITIVMMKLEIRELKVLLNTHIEFRLNNLERVVFNRGDETNHGSST